jgi:hypothetical protein
MLHRRVAGLHCKVTSTAAVSCADHQADGYQGREAARCWIKVPWVERRVCFASSVWWATSRRTTVLSR